MTDQIINPASHPSYLGQATFDGAEAEALYCAAGYAVDGPTTFEEMRASLVRFVANFEAGRADATNQASIMLNEIVALIPVVAAGWAHAIVLAKENPAWVARRDAHYRALLLLTHNLLAGLKKFGPVIEVDRG